MKQILRTRWTVAAVVVGVLLLVALYSLFSSLTGSGERIVYLDDDDNIDSVAPAAMMWDRARVL